MAWTVPSPIRAYLFAGGSYTVRCIGCGSRPNGCRVCGSPPPDARPPEVSAVVEARPGSLAASDDEREPEGGPAGDEVG